MAAQRLLAGDIFQTVIKACETRSGMTEVRGALSVASRNRSKTGLSIRDLVYFRTVLTPAWKLDRESAHRKTAERRSVGFSGVAYVGSR